MIAAIILNWSVVAGLLVIAYLQYTDPLSWGNESWGFFSFFVSLFDSAVIFSVAIVLIVASIFAMLRYEGMRIAYCIMSGVVVMLLLTEWIIVDDSAMVWRWALLLVQILATVLVLLPSSAPYFLPQPAIPVSEPPLLVEDWPPSIVLPFVEDSSQQSDSGFQRVKPVS